MPNLAWTYTTLMQALQDWEVHGSTKFLTNVPNIVGLGERRLVGDLNIEAYDKVDVSVLTVTGTRQTAKPGDVIQVRNVGLMVSGRYTELELRSLDYCKQYAADPSVLAVPEFYAELSFNEIYLSPTPDAVYPVDYHYIGAQPETLSPLTPNATTWLSRSAPDALLAACLAESEQFIKADDRYQDMLTKYNNELLPRLRAELRNSIRSGDYSPVKGAATTAG